MREIEHYRNVVLGTGESSKYTAWTPAKAGKCTGVVERGRIGGSCPNIACLKSKNIIHSAKVASLFQRATEFGVEIGPNIACRAGHSSSNAMPARPPSQHVEWHSRECNDSIVC